MRSLAVLLLLAAAVHPLVHFADAATACPCVHGAIVEVLPPGVSRHAPVPLDHTNPPEAPVLAVAASDVPARAPPAA